jgi:hypothetical protein
MASIRLAKKVIATTSYQVPLVLPATSLAGVKADVKSKQDHPKSLPTRLPPPSQLFSSLTLGFKRSKP